MSKNTLIIVIVLIVLAGGFFLFNKSGEAPTIDTSGEMESAMPVPGFEGEVDEMIVSEDEDAMRDNAAPLIHAVTYTAEGFSPATITISAGETVRFVSAEGLPMRVASNPHPAHTDFSEFDQRGAGNEYSFTFEKAGTYHYHNHQRPAEEGTVIVN